VGTCLKHKNKEERIEGDEEVCYNGGYFFVTFVGLEWRQICATKFTRNEGIQIHKPTAWNGSYNTRLYLKYFFH